MLPLLDWLTLAAWICLWAGYQWFSFKPRGGRESLTALIVPIRRQWMLEALNRENRISDASLVGNLLHSATFFSSTTLLILGGLFAFISSIDENIIFVSNLPFAAATSLQVLEFKFVILAFVFIYALFRFLWSIRQFNLLTILIGAYPTANIVLPTATDAPFKATAPQTTTAAPRTTTAASLATTAGSQEATAPLPVHVASQATRLNTLAGNNFAQALRAYYYAVPILLWLVNPWLFLAGSIVVTSAVYYTEYRSETARALLAPIDNPIDNSTASASRASQTSLPRT